VNIKTELLTVSIQEIRAMEARTPVTSSKVCEDRDMTRSAPVEGVDRVEPVQVDDAMLHRRWVVLALLFAIIVINFMDRQTMSMLAPVLRSVLHLSNTAYGRIVAALQFGMMSCEFPIGWMMDRWGARLGLTAAALIWSAITGSQFFTRSGVQLGITRYWMGTAEVASISGGMKTVSHLFTDKERTLAIGIFNSGTVIGTVLAPLLVVILLQRYGFRVAFLAPALLAFLWLPFWWVTQRGNRLHPKATDVSATPARVLLGSSSTWAVMLCRMLIGPVMQFYWYWTPSYLYSTRHMSLVQIGLVGWIPFLLGVSGGIAGGAAAGWLQARKFSLYNTRRITMFGSSLLCVASLAVPWMASATTALVMISVAIMAHNFLSANMYAAITDLFPGRLVGRVTGLTGVSGGLSGLMLPLLTGVLVDHFSCTPVFVLIAFMPLLGTVALFLVGRRYRMQDTKSQQVELVEG
jgi:ACS family hexuronate transporter-like MFS transporter